ncbi:MAG: hypothetical protein L0Y70_20360 [Gemmataceae bacterium]|nr:hypothetical protein [Gemmataceae bacterium]
MRAALGTLPWVEHGTVKTDTDKREVHFNLKDKDAFNEDAMKVALKGKGFPEMAVTGMHR